MDEFLIGGPLVSLPIEWIDPKRSCCLALQLAAVQEPSEWRDMISMAMLVHQPFGRVSTYESS